MIAFAARNLKVFFRDRTSVFFSLLAVFIIIGLYVLFLGDVWTSSIGDLTGVRFLMDSWIMAGLLAVTSVTTTMGAFGTMVDDRAKKISKDFYSSPIGRGSLTAGYIISSYIIGVIMTLVTLVLAEIYIVAYGGALLSLSAALQVVGLILISTLASTSMVLFIVSFFNSASAFATASTIIGTLIGFLTGIYLPVGQLPDAVQWIVKVFPVSHAAALLRQTMMASPLSQAFNGAPAEAAESFKELMGVNLRFGDAVASPIVSLLILAGTAVLFFALSLLNLSRKRK
ncbi:multidrug/hemolysin transport system permease protein [Sporobacter termitidis DSM 10068]|uniref:Multidrug/hemolysin transport system permease protein n=1 Tax=Sporobacter termitidis DSM 10068 TaxID=1123282 RepID=A0A1M5TN78_9FIRM|nr:ABC transporter permease [Sporobacter termitidis]SHH52148.1 multidrug/hemolysin transport system permease protein [Sporobacter termitidis DSM 10068]